MLTDPKSFVERYARAVFAFTLNLLGGSPDKAYDIAASGFAEAMASAAFPASDPERLAAVVRCVLEKARNAEIVPSSAGEGPERIVRGALASLSLDERALILLRDQMNLEYGVIAALLDLSDKNVKNRTIEARLDLRKKVEKALHHAG